MEDSEYIPCGNCLKYFPETHIATHYTYCSKYIKKCQHCRQFYDITEKQTHFEEYHRLIQCSFCKGTFLPKDLDEHQPNCSRQLLPCKFCQEKYSKGILNIHMKDCETRKVSCKKCDYLIMNREYKVHLESCRGTGIKEIHKGLTFEDYDYDELYLSPEESPESIQYATKIEDEIDKTLFIIPEVNIEDQRPKIKRGKKFQQEDFYRQTKIKLKEKSNQNMLNREQAENIVNIRPVQMIQDGQQQKPVVLNYKNKKQTSHQDELDFVKPSKEKENLQTQKNVELSTPNIAINKFVPTQPSSTLQEKLNCHYKESNKHRKKDKEVNPIYTEYSPDNSFQSLVPLLEKPPKKNQITEGVEKQQNCKNNNKQKQQNYMTEGEDDELYRALQLSMNPANNVDHNNIKEYDVEEMADNPYFLEEQMKLLQFFRNVKQN